MQTAVSRKATGPVVGLLLLVIALTGSAYGQDSTDESDLSKAKVPYDLEKFQPVLSQSRLHSPRTENPIAVRAGRFRGYELPNRFYLGKDGTTMVMATTRDDHDRTELRHNAMWPLMGEEKRLSARLRFDKPVALGGQKSHLNLMQIFLRGETEDPMVLVQWSGSWEADGNEDRLSAFVRGREEKPFDLGPRPDGFFNVDVSVEEGTLRIYIANELKAEADVSMFKASDAFFKTGADHRGIKAHRVEFESLSITWPPPAYMKGRLEFIESYPGGIDWMQQGPLGVMVHWLSETAPAPGTPRPKDFNEAVDAFPVEAFCDQIAATGAGWVIFPFGQNLQRSGLYCSPNAYLDEHLPGHTSKRDLFREIAEGATQRGMRVIAYLPSAVANNKKEIQTFFGWDLDPVDKKEFQRNYARMVRSWSESMGPLISAWWFDGGYQGQRTGYTHGKDRFEIPEWGEAVRAGNPESVYAINPGANTFHYVSEDEGFLAGEARDVNVSPGGPLIGDKQWHSLVAIDCRWIHRSQRHPIPPPRFGDRQLHTHVHRIFGNGGAATLNIGIYLDGTMPEATLDQVTRIAGWVKAGLSPSDIFDD